MMANEALRAMMEATGARNSDIAAMLGMSTGNVSSDVAGYVKPGVPRGMTVSKLLAYAGALGYGLVLVPEGGGEEIRIDGVARYPGRAAGAGERGEGDAR